MGSYAQLKASLIASPVPSSLSMQASASSNQNGNSLTVAGYATAVLSVTGTMGGGTIVLFEAKADASGSNWVPIQGRQVGSSTSGAGTSLAGDWIFDVAGYYYLRARVASYSSGSVTVVGYVIALPSAQSVGPFPSYSACNDVFTITANPQDIICFVGSSTKTCKIQRMRLFSYTNSSESTNPFYLIKRKTANTGSFTTVTAVPFDSNSPPPTGGLVYYTGNPTAGTAVGNISVPTIVTPLTGATSFYVPPFYDLYVASDNGLPLTLRGTNESVCLNFNGAALPSGMKLKLEVIWTEE